MERLKKDQASDYQRIESLKRAVKILDSPWDTEALLQDVGEASIVLLGESTHGTHEFYTWRSAISKRLIEEKGFRFIAVEGDWPDCYTINRYIKYYPDSGTSSYELLHNFNRWPTWMWANWEIKALVDWLRSFNSNRPPSERIGFYGLDVYSLSESLEHVLNYVKKNDKNAYSLAREAIQCFAPYGFEGGDYARATQWKTDSCMNEVVHLLSAIRKKVTTYNTDPEAGFNAEQNALIAVHAENYYRIMLKGGPHSWNLRDQHMVETIERLMSFHEPHAKAIIWEHNTHIGDARATDMKKQGMVNVGGLLTEKYPKGKVFKIGLGTYEGDVIAGSYWGDNMRVVKIPKGVPGSWESLLHHAGKGSNLYIRSLDLFSDATFGNFIGHRAIGVIYHPNREFPGNYLPSILPERYDAFIHIDKTKALYAMHLKPDGHQMPETYPWGF